MFRWGGWLVGLPVLFLTCRAVWHNFVHDTSFALRKVDNALEREISTQELMKTGGFQQGDNLMLLSLPHVAARLRKHPQIKWVRLRRKMPNTLVVELKTQKPAAIVMFDRPHLMSASGIPYRVASASQQKGRLLRIEGIRKAEYLAYPKAYQVVFRHALALQTVYREHGLAEFQPLRSVRIERVGGYTLLAGRTTIELGHDRLLERLKALQKVYRLVRKPRVRNIQTIHLNLDRHLNRAVIKFYRSQPLSQVANKNAVVAR